MTPPPPPRPSVVPVLKSQGSCYQSKPSLPGCRSRRPHIIFFIWKLDPVLAINKDITAVAVNFCDLFGTFSLWPLNLGAEVSFTSLVRAFLDTVFAKYHDRHPGKTEVYLKQPNQDCAINKGLKSVTLIFLWSVWYGQCAQLCMVLTNTSRLLQIPKPLILEPEDSAEWIIN